MKMYNVKARSPNEIQSPKLEMYNFRFYEQNERSLDILSFEPPLTLACLSSDWDFEICLPTAGRDFRKWV